MSDKRIGETISERKRRKRAYIKSRRVKKKSDKNEC